MEVGRPYAAFPDDSRGRIERVSDLLNLPAWFGDSKTGQPLRDGRECDPGSLLDGEYQADETRGVDGGGE